VLLGFTASCSCWASRSRNEPYLAASKAHPKIQNPLVDGSAFCAITAKRSRPWTSSPYRPLPFGVLYGFFVIAHDRRRILHYNVTRHPTSAWIVQQLREAFPYEPATQFLILDHDSKYGTEVSAAIRSMNIKVVRTAIGCPWQNGVAERWVGSCRRELLDHVIAIRESHLKRLLSSYVAYYHQDRTHCGLEKQTPQKRTCCSGRGKVVAWPRVGGLHHRYERAA